MQTTTPNPQPQGTGFLTDPQKLLGDSQRKVLSLFNTQNIIIFSIGFILVILGVIFLWYLLLFTIYKIQTLIDKQDKSVNWLEVYFNQYIKYKDTKFLQTKVNLFKRLDQIIRSSGQIVSFEIHQSTDSISCRGVVKFLVSSSNSQTLETVKSLLIGIDGLKIHNSVIIEKQNSRIAENYKIKKVVYKNPISPIYFKSNNIFSDIIQGLISSEYTDAGCVVMIRSSNPKDSKTLLNLYSNGDS